MAELSEWRDARWIVRRMLGVLFGRGDEILMAWMHMTRVTLMSKSFLTYNNYCFIVLRKCEVIMLGIVFSFLLEINLLNLCYVDDRKVIVFLCSTCCLN